MKRLLTFVILIVFATIGWAQDTQPKMFESNIVQRRLTPSVSDINCAGFITRQSISTRNHIRGMKDSPDASEASTGKIVYLAGDAYEVGAKYRIVRRIKDPNRMEISKDQTKLVKGFGDTWADIGIVEVKYLDGRQPIAEIQFSCEPAFAGDVLIPYEDRLTPELTHNPKQYEVFGVATGPITGRIIESKDFDFLLGTGRKVYVDLGSSNGLKPGEYLRITRGYDWKRDVIEVDQLSAKADFVNDTSDRMPVIQNKTTGDLPRHGIGEMVILSVTPGTATAMVTLALEDIHIGDQVETTVAPQ